ncbi:MalY/PatB family protein [Pedobacter sp. SYP-B3415]|uniref:MalY/PatB family protein n=1 Tax=Pedobacter sp. SYP-B3415 TaxID=2496641 RepID=UPI00101C422D|nr:MalY/PatB family protein [Pedobacter sp. SYP-B3415]
MKYNFDQIRIRKGTHSIKWDANETEEILPMWIADMDFQTFPPLAEALTQIVKQGNYGYNMVPHEVYAAIIHWWQKRHGCTVEKDWILASTGVSAAVSAIIATLTDPGDEVIIQTPAYNHFFDVVNGGKCRILENRIIYENGTYRLDFKDLERKASSHKAKILLLCNPHNPIGRAWTEAELQKVAAICARHGVYVISDEIHCDLVAHERGHISFLKIATGQNLPFVVCGAASKTFNLSGLHAAYLFISDSELRKNVERQLWAQGTGTPSLMACEALTISYTQGDEWVAELNWYIAENYRMLKAFIEKHLNQIVVVQLEATYLVWLDCSQTGMKSKDLADLLLQQEKLWVNPGAMYGAAGEGFLRINIACPRETLREGLTRLKNVLEKFC